MINSISELLTGSEKRTETEGEAIMKTSMKESSYSARIMVPLLLLAVFLLLSAGITAASAEDRYIRLTHGRFVEYADDAHTTIVRTENIPLSDYWFLPKDDVVIIRETDEDWYKGFEQSHSLAAGCAVSYGTSPVSGGNIPAGTKVMIQETDETIHIGKASGNASNVVFSSIPFVESTGAENENILSDYVQEISGDAEGQQYAISLNGLRIPIKYKGKDYGEIEVEEGDIILHYDHHWEHIQLRLTHISVEVAIASVSLNLETPPLNLITIPLGKFGVELVPGIISLDFTPSFFVDLAGTGSVDFRFNAEDGFSGSLTFGIIPHDFSSIHVEPTFGFNRAKIGAKVKAGIAWGPGIELVECVKVACEYEAGVVFDGWTSVEENPPKGPDWHACKDLACYQAKVYAEYGPWKVVLEAGGHSKELWKITEPVPTDPFAWMYHSDTFNDGSTSMLCPHMGYRLNVHVVDQDNKPLKDALVSYSPEETQFDKWGKNVSQQDDGNWRLYIPLTYPSKENPAGKTNKVTVTAAIPDPTHAGKTITVSQEVTEAGLKDSKPDPEEITIKLDMREVTLTFEDGSPESGAAADIPKPITVVLAGSKGIQIPDTIPKKSGNHFIGWTTGKDGSGEKYTPGSLVDMSDGKNVTLYAQFRAILDTYVVMYNANGGTYAPPSQTAKMGEKLTLTAEPARHANYHFLGWARDPGGFELEFPYGQVNVLENKDNQRVITLYAIWQFDPVDEPIKLTYDMNGGPEQQKPNDRWIPRNTWIVLSRVIPVWDDMHIFSGWSTDPNAFIGEYKPGEAFVMSDNTTLYAIWNFTPSPYPGKLQFKDTGSGTAYGIPAEIIFDPGSVVQIPDNIPKKSGLQFIGWNTAPDGSGDAYQPGLSFMPPDEMTLYAQWVTLRNSYVILYNANGGEYAPKAQTVSLDEIAVLTDEPAKWGEHIFLGWSYDDLSVEAEFPAGKTNVLNNPDNKTLIVLYAVWSYKPVNPPMELSYDINGGPKEQCPRSQFAMQGSFLAIDGSIPAWDAQHDFLGWAENANAAAAQYKPGDSIRMDRDRTLYAVWNAHYKIIQGIGSRWRLKTKTGLRFVADGNIKYFHYLMIDGKVITTDRYTLTSGSTVADLPAELLNTLSVGDHRICFVYDDGSAEGTFTVLSPIPITGDSADPALWLGMILAGLAAAAFLMTRKSGLFRE